MPKHVFTVVLDYDDDAHVETAELGKLVNDAVLEAIPDAGSRAPGVTVSEAAVPRVLVSVTGGVADITAVDGVADVALVDYDHDDDRNEEDVEEALAFGRHTGTAEEMDSHLAEARKDLEDMVVGGMDL